MPGRWSKLLNGSCLFRRSVLKMLAKLETSKLTVTDNGGTHEFGQHTRAQHSGSITVRDRRFYHFAALGGSIGAAEAYIRGYWDSPDLTTTMRVLAANANVLNSMENGFTRLLQPLRSLAYRLRSNSLQGSKRNIAAHYDLSNDFFAHMLDPTMTYSSGVYPHETATLEEASNEKYDRICRKLNLGPDDHVLEIGTGWGGFAEHAVKNYGCRVTTTTISEQQHEYAAHRFAATGLDRPHHATERRLPQPKRQVRQAGFD